MRSDLRSFVCRIEWTPLPGPHGKLREPREVSTVAKGKNPGSAANHVVRNMLEATIIEPSQEITVHVEHETFVFVAYWRAVADAVSHKKEDKPWQPTGE